ncbi:uncharacterized protein LOC111342364 isoform X2 [Stylophora pistillata]|uniref:uncharacterized protein LOC111342364 isoform X2 n=1 Tax=Stylophora pistillata TaxID=50429 RepID=UPI000C03D3C1|nr:uncharacterized protein LOC111342364 isoform X2 [Stylophora pistillata]
MLRKGKSKSIYTGKSMMDIFRSSVFRVALATLLLCSTIQKSESFRITKTPSNPTVVVLEGPSKQIELEWQFSDAPNSLYFVQLWRQKPDEVNKQLAISNKGNAFSYPNGQNLNEFEAFLPARLVLKNVKRDEEYTYSIHLLDSTTKVVGQDSVTLDVVVPPKITVTPEPKPSLTIGENYTLTCNASGDPFPNITWTKDGTPAEEFNVTGYKLHFINVELKDVGSYRCTASNGYGDDATSVSIASIRCNDCELKTVGIILRSETWKSALNNQQSVEFKTLRANVLSEISKVYAKNPEKQLYSVALLDFRSGSVVARVQMKFGKSVTDPLKPLEDGIKDGNLGAFRVNRELDLNPTTLPPTSFSSTTSEEPQTPAADARSSGLSQLTLWGIIGGSIAFVLVVVIVIVVSCICCRKKGGASKGGRNYSEADGYRMNKQPPSGLGTASPAYVEARQYASVSAPMRQNEQRKPVNYMEPSFDNSPAPAKQPPPYSATEYSELAPQKRGQQGGEGGGFELWC